MGRFDVTFKALADEAPEVALNAIASERLLEGVTFQPIPRDLTEPVKSVDHAFLMKRGEEIWVEHMEAEVGLSSADRLAIHRRAALIWGLYLVPVHTTILLMKRRGSPAKPVETFGGEYGTYTGFVKPFYRRLWEIPASLFLSSGRVEALPWVGAAQATQDEMEEAIRLIRRVPDVELRRRLSAAMATLSGLQYNEHEVANIREELDMATSEDIMRASVVGEQLIADGVKKGREEGRKVGREEGRIGALRKHVALMIALRAPGHSAAAKLEWIDNADLLDSLFHRLVQSSGPAETAKILDEL